MNSESKAPLMRSAVALIACCVVFAAPACGDDGSSPGDDIGGTGGSRAGKGGNAGAGPKGNTGGTNSSGGSSPSSGGSASGSGGSTASGGSDPGIGGSEATGGKSGGSGGSAGKSGTGGSGGREVGPCSPDAPATLKDYVADHSENMKRVACNSEVALYFDDALAALPAQRTAWILPFVTETWMFIKDNYGSCAVPRDLPAPIGPGCERYGQEQLYVFFHQNAHLGGTIANRFDGFSGYRNTIDVGDNGWNESNRVLHDEIVHEACHQVEGAGQGVHESPAFGVIWGDSKWVEFCMYDYYVRSGRTDYAKQVFDQFTKNRDNLPTGTTGAAWFRDWFYPLWKENGENAAVMERFFGLLSQHFPKHLENNNRNYVYDRRMNPGEYVHFTSGAAKKDLSARAATAFSGFSRAQFEQAKKDFPKVTY